MKSFSEVAGSVVYLDEMVKATGSTREAAWRWLKANGYYKPTKSGKRWVKFECGSLLTVTIA